MRTALPRSRWTGLKEGDGLRASRCGMMIIWAHELNSKTTIPLRDTLARPLRRKS